MLIKNLNNLGFFLICLQIYLSYQNDLLKSPDDVQHNDIIKDLESTNEFKSEENVNTELQKTELPEKHTELNYRPTDNMQNCEKDLVKKLCKIKTPVQHCPRLEKKCDPAYPYRLNDGSCNNLENSWWGRSGGPYKRFLPPDYGDKFGHQRLLGKDGKPLINERALSAKLISSYRSKSEWSIFFLAFGQFFVHDTSQLATTTNSNLKQKPCMCSSKDNSCYNVKTPFGDYLNHDQKCMIYARSCCIQEKFDCNLGEREQINLVTSFADLGLIYGNDPVTATELRTFKAGLLKTSRTPHSNLEQLATPKGSKCPFSRDRSEKCFKSGDTRAEDNVILLSLHALWTREHNRVSRKLASINPQWRDETLYQEARRIVIAEYQHILAHEFIPSFLGETISREYNLLPLREEYLMEYNKNIYSNLINEFAAAAFRIGHTLVNEDHHRADKFLRNYDTFNISACQFNSARFAINSPLEDVLYGTLNNPSYKKACQMNIGMNNFIFDGVYKNRETKRYSLFVTNVHRGRDHGFPGYNYYREICGLNRAKNFEDLSNNIPEPLIHRLRKVYSHVDDIDLYAGLIAENPLKGSVAGYTAACIIAKQFKELKLSDRFWYENGHDKNIRFTISQLNEIKQATSARIICDNSNVNSIQRYPFMMPDKNWNPWIECSHLQKVNLRPWTDTKMI